MQLWFARGSEVTIREQLVTQVILGILSDDLAAHAEKFCRISPIEWNGMVKLSSLPDLIEIAAIRIGT